MKPRCLLVQLIAFISVYVGTVPCNAQVPARDPTLPNREPQERVKVFTEEIVIPVSSYDYSGHLNPFLEPEDIIVFEDDVGQQVRSIRRIPANVLIVMD